MAILKACLESGTLLVAFCALVLVPFVIWTLSRLSLPLLRGIDDHRRRALAAGLLALAPGASFAAAAGVVMARAIRAGCLEMPGGRAVVVVIALLLGLAFTRAFVQAWNRHRQVDRLVRAASPPSQRLHSSALAVNVDAREMPSGDPLIFVAGVRRPIVFVSRGALERLGDAELAAALTHERAHARHGDQLLMSALLFFTDLLPLCVAGLTELYRDSREFAADRAAIETADPVDLASAILGVVSARRIGPIAALADACVRARLTWLLDGAASTSGRFPSFLKYVAAVQLMLLVTLAIAAIVLPACRISL